MSGTTRVVVVVIDEMHSAVAGVANPSDALQKLMVQGRKTGITDQQDADSVQIGVYADGEPAFYRVGAPS